MLLSKPPVSSYIKNNCLHLYHHNWFCNYNCYNCSCAVLHFSRTLGYTFLVDGASYPHTSFRHLNNTVSMRDGRVCVCFPQYHCYFCLLMTSFSIIHQLKWENTGLHEAPMINSKSYHPQNTNLNSFLGIYLPKRERWCCVTPMPCNPPPAKILTNIDQRFTCRLIPPLHQISLNKNPWYLILDY